MAKDFSETNRPGIVVRGTSEVVEKLLAERDKDSIADQKKEEVFLSTLAGRISSVFSNNKRAREEAGVDQEMEDSVLQANGEYTQKEKGNLDEDEPEVFMNITATKSRAARSWIKDLTQPPDGWPFSFASTPEETLPPEILTMIEEAFKEDEKRITEEITKQAQAPPPSPAAAPPSPTATQGAPQEQGQTSAPAQPAPMSASQASRKLREISKLRREIEEAVRNEVNLHSTNEIRRIERKVQDSLAQGGWQQAFSDFIFDFTIFPTAFMKGPNVTTGKTLVWEGGVPKVQRNIVFETVRVSPFDCYPDPTAATPQEGNFCEHVRLSRKQLSDLGGLNEANGYFPRDIQQLLTDRPQGVSLAEIDTGLEERRAQFEKRGGRTFADEGLYHGIHFWGTASVKELKDFGYPSTLLVDDSGRFFEPWEELEIEALMIGSTIIKCIVNQDPLGRRPYYAASFHPRPGSIWGLSLPFLMRDIQKMCNAAARALAVNMAFSSGPQCGILVDRLADDSDPSDQTPRKTWQFTSDPQGNGGRPIEWFNVPSMMNELLAIFNAFEGKADDVTGVPRYAYGNDNVGGAGQTAQGLSMLLESASKGIKSAIKNISEGVITKRVEYQFYMELLKAKESNAPLNFTGDINVVVHAVEAINIRAAELESSQNLLKLMLSSPVVADMLGYEGMGTVLRKVFKSANFPETAIPTSFDLREKQTKKEAEAKAAQEQMAQTQQGRSAASVQATEIQAEATDKANARTIAFKEKELETRRELQEKDNIIKQGNLMIQASKVDKAAEAAQARIEQQEATTNKKLAVDVQKHSQKDQIPPTEAGGV